MGYYAVDYSLHYSIMTICMSFSSINGTLVIMLNSCQMGRLIKIVTSGLLALQAMPAFKVPFSVSKQM